MRYFYRLVILSIVMQTAWCTSTSSSQDNFCTKIIHDCEISHGIPRELLHAVALVESGRKANGKFLKPWPWTINAEGKPYILETRAKAVQKAKSLRNQGIKSMDLGPMQINLYHHPNAFSNLNKAFDIRKNVEYAASLLQKNYEQTKSWFQAVAHYHSKNPKRGERYKRKVLKAWQRLLSQKSSDKAVPNSVINSSNTQIKSVNGDIDIKMIPLNKASFNNAIDISKKFIPINGKSTGYGLGNSSKAAYKLTQGRKFFKIY